MGKLFYRHLLHNTAILVIKSLATSKIKHKFAITNLPTRQTRNDTSINLKTETIMKKIIALAILMLSSVATFAQQSVGTFSIQYKAGLNIADLTDEYGSDPRLGLVAGVEFMYQASSLLGVSFGALYSMQGSKDDGITAKLDYINIPILANLYAAKGFAIKLGLQPGFNINTKLSSNGSSVNIDTYRISGNTVELSTVVGMSYECKSLVIDCRYNIGLTRVVNGFDDRNRVIQITLGYKVPL